jgi:lipid-A-disaccharide synthase
VTRLLLSCGEASGDLYAGALVEALRQREPDVDVFGLGGERFAAAGGRLVADFHGLSVTGLTEALSVIPRSFATMKQLVKAAKDQKPDALVVIDYPDFNFSLMKRIKRLGIPVVYYVSPQLWAWRAGRIRQMKRSVPSDSALALNGVSWPSSVHSSWIFSALPTVGRRWKLPNDGETSWTDLTMRL